MLHRMSAVTFSIPDGRSDLVATLFGLAAAKCRHCEMRRGSNGNTLVSLELNADDARAADAAMAETNSRRCGSESGSIARCLMTEIRICWSKAVSFTKLSGSGGGLWLPETPKNREELEAYVEAGNHGFGQGTHWIERRQA
jgi:hypothetical protein